MTLDDMIYETNQPDDALIPREKVIETLNGQKLDGIEEGSDPHVAKIVMKAWNEAIRDCITAIKKL